MNKNNEIQRIFFRYAQFRPIQLLFIIRLVDCYESAWPLIGSFFSCEYVILLSSTLHFVDHSDNRVIAN